jgi:hypothetical protein
VWYLSSSLSLVCFQSSESFASFQQPAHVEQVVLEDVAAGARLDRGCPPVRIVVLGHDQDPRRRVGGQEPPNRFEAADAGHLQVKPFCAEPTHI